MSDIRSSASSDRLRALTEVAREGRSDVRTLTEGIKRLSSESQKLAAQVTSLPSDENDPRTKIVLKLRRKLRRDPTMAEVLEEELKQTREKHQHDLEVVEGKLTRREMDYDDAVRKADSLEREASRAKMVAEVRSGAWRLSLVLVMIAICLLFFTITRHSPIPRYRVEAAAVVTGTNITNVVVVPVQGDQEGFTLPVPYRIDTVEDPACSVASVTTVRLLPTGKVQALLRVPPGHDGRQDRCNFIPLHGK